MSTYNIIHMYNHISNGQEDITYKCYSFSAISYSYFWSFLIETPEIVWIGFDQYEKLIYGIRLQIHSGKNLLSYAQFIAPRRQTTSETVWLNVSNNKELTLHIWKLNLFTQQINCFCVHNR